MSFFRRRDGGVAALVDVLPEAAAVCAVDGRMEAANGAWRAAFGEGPRLPRGAGGGLFAALVAGRRTGRAEGVLEIGAVRSAIAVAALPGERFFLRRLGATAPASANRALPQGSGMLEPLAAVSPFGAALIDGDDVFDGVIAGVNEALVEIAGPGAAAGGTLGALVTTASRTEAQARIVEGQPGPFEVRLAQPPHRTVDLYLARRVGRVTAYLLDVTDQKAMQIQLSQRNKMEAVGQLAGGVAHDFNNLLTAIRLRTDELLLRHSLGDPSYDSLSEIRQTVVRAAGVVRQLLTFSRKATIQREVLDLGEVLSNFEVLLRRLLREDVRLETRYGANLPLVRADKAQIENAVMNLVVNARDAVA
ncbi:MAG: histidine kinase dimerization/phospho-acceptor domain-containing protein, partial [Caulobacteraceae bacterium]